MRSLSYFYRSWWCLLAVLLCAAPAAWAQDAEPRAFSNGPVGMNFLIAGYAYTNGALSFDPSVPVTDANFVTNSAVLAYARVLDLGGISGKFDVSEVYTGLSGSALLSGSPIERDVDGFGDLRFRLTANFYGAPAVNLKQFADYKQDLIIGASIQVTAPTGQYDDTKAVNLGTNRWSFKPEIGMSKVVGPFTLEAAAAVTLYTDNNDFLGRTRSQEPIYSAQGHVIYGIGKGIWFSGDVTYFIGGQSSINGDANDDMQNNWRLGVTVAFPVNKYTSIKCYASTGVSSRTDNDYDLVGVALQFRWGAGL